MSCGGFSGSRAVAFFRGLRGEKEGGGKGGGRGVIEGLTFSLNALGGTGCAELGEWLEGVGDGFRVLNLDSCQIDTSQVFLSL